MLQAKTPEKGSWSSRICRQIGLVICAYGPLITPNPWLPPTIRNFCKFFRFRNRQAAQSQRIQQLKNGGIRSASKGQRKNRDQRKCGTLPQLPEGISEILDHPVHVRPFMIRLAYSYLSATMGSTLAARRAGM